MVAEALPHAPFTAIYAGFGLRPFQKAAKVDGRTKSGQAECGEREGYVTRLTTYATVSTVRMATVAQDIVL